MDEGLCVAVGSITRVLVGKGIAVTLEEMKVGVMIGADADWQAAMPNPPKRNMSKTIFVFSGPHALRGDASLVLHVITSLCLSVERWTWLFH